MTRSLAMPIPMIVVAQLALLGMAFVLLTAWPPSSGRMMLVALDGAGASHMVQDAVDGQALLVGPGPFRLSYVVYGDRSVIRAALPANVIVIAAPAAGCGSTEDAIA